MLILGIETSCDETAAAVVKDGKEILSNIIASQEELHVEFGGVVPEIACRAHLESIVRVIDKAISAANVELKNIDAIAIANTPGLVGALLIGLTAAKSISWVLDIPIIAINHLHAHLYAINLTSENIQYPLIGLLASGGHTSLFLIKNETDYTYLGGTLDDAAGEAFDKVAKILGLGYPGGPKIDKIAKNGDKNTIPFPRSYLAKDSLDFSFSGIKTSVLYHFQGTHRLTNPERETRDADGLLYHKEIADIAASFQESVVEVLVKKSLNAFKKYSQLHETGLNSTMDSLQSVLYSPVGIAVGGGVARNSRLREKFKEVSDKMNIPVLYPLPVLCTDNAAMVAGLAYHKFKENDFADLSLEAIPDYHS